MKVRNTQKKDKDEDKDDEEEEEEEGTRTNSSETEESEESLWATVPPPLEYFDAIKGYEMVSFDAVSVPPPLSPPESPQNLISSPFPKISLPDFEPRLVEEEIRKAFLSHVRERCCYGVSAAKNMRISKMEFNPAYHYELQSFSEKRETAWTIAPVSKGAISTEYSSSRGIPPLPWDILEVPSTVFKDEVRLLPIPNTSSTKSCHRCRGTGGMLCRDCNGKGWIRCINCHGDGWMSDSSGYRERCFYCQHSRHGQGHQDCGKCHSKGKVHCSTCEGSGQICCFIQLSISWKVHTSEHIVEHLQLPHELVRDVSGQVAFEDERAKVSPISSFDDEEVNEASKALVHSSLSVDLEDHKLIRQRHQVRVIPVTKVFYDWKGSPESFFIYGYENKVYCPKYPQSCCWGCHLL